MALNAEHKDGGQHSASVSEPGQDAEIFEMLQGFERSAGSARIKMLQQKLADLQRTSQQTDSMLRMQMVTETAAKRNIWKR